MEKRDPVAVLMQEHRVIARAWEAIHSLRNVWEGDPARYGAAVRSLVVFFREYSDRYHHNKEESILFKELRAHPAFLFGDLLDELENHHEMFRESVSEIEEASLGGDWPRVQKLLEDYMNDLLDHIAVEDEELFVASSSLFDEAWQERMYFFFEDIDRELGLARKEELEGSIQAVS